MWIREDVAGRPRFTDSHMRMAGDQEGTRAKRGLPSEVVRTGNLWSPTFLSPTATPYLAGDEDAQRGPRGRSVCQRNGGLECERFEFGWRLNSEAVGFTRPTNASWPHDLL